jgi:hypothetical protein
MSILQIPRIHFKGHVSWDPIVTNNSQAFYDENAALPVLTPTETMAQFRRSAIDDTLGSNWNAHGTHRSRFFNTCISAVDVGNGPVTADKLCGAPAQFTGMLVDLEPYGAFTSQLFFDQITFGIDGGCRLVAPRKERFTARYINFSRNPEGYIAGIASVNWQTTFSRAGLTIDKHDSLALAAFEQALGADDAEGIVITFNAYRTIYFNDPSLQNGKPNPHKVTLREKLLTGGFQPNPARSRLVGTIGIWRKGDPSHEPGDRALLAQSATASAHARCDRDRVTLDLSNCIPETGFGLEKQNFGTLQLAAVDPGTGQEQALASIAYAQYDKAAYELGAGIVSVPVDPALLARAAQANLVIRAANGDLLLSEAPRRLIPTLPNTYLDQGTTGTVTFQLYEHGQPLQQVADTTVFQMDNSGSTVTATMNLATDAFGRLTIQAPADQARVVAYIAQPGKDAPAPENGIDTQQYNYAYVRILPADVAIAALAPTWTNVYQNVLINWNAMAPCMDNWLDLADSDQIKAHAFVLKKLTDPTALENYRFMPVTRDMTPGQRALLYKFLDAPAAGALGRGVPAQAVPVKNAETAVEAELSSFAQLSRSMREHKLE